jgi:hypothetical protein
MARISQAHRTQITIAVITMITGIAVAFIANLDKIFPRDTPPQAQNQAQRAPPPSALQSEDGALPAAQRLKESEERAMIEYANAIDDITRQIEAQSANKN